VFDVLKRSISCVSDPLGIDGSFMIPPLLLIKTRRRGSAVIGIEVETIFGLDRVPESTNSPPPDPDLGSETAIF